MSTNVYCEIVICLADNDNEKYHGLNDGHIICSSVLLFSMRSL